MPNNTVSDWSTTPASNTEVGGVDLAENSMRPRDVNNAIRTMMAQIATGIDNSEFGGVPQFHPATAAGPASLDFAEDTDNGTNKVTLKAPASIAADVDLTLPGTADTLVGRATTDTLTNKTLTTPTMTGPVVTTSAMDLQVGQIAFPATQNAAAGANTLDDYEEGTWTPGMTFGGSATGITYSTQTGYYVKVGRLVFFMGTITLTNNGSGTGAANITGLPFTSINVNAVANVTVNNYSNFSGLTFSAYGYVVLNTTTAALLQGGATANGVLTDTNITNTASFYFSGVYEAAA